MVIFIFTFGEHLSLNTLALPVFFFFPTFSFLFFLYYKDVFSFIIPPPFFPFNFRVPTPLFIYFFFFLLFFLIRTCVCSFKVQRRFSYLTLPHLKKKKEVLIAFLSDFVFFFLFSFLLLFFFIARTFQKSLRNLWG